MQPFQQTPLAVAVALALVATSTWAESDQTTTEFELNPLVATTTLSTETAESSLSSVTVIDPESMDRQSPRDWSDVLQGQPGLNVITNGSFGKNTSVFTRGTGSESTVLLIDGVRVRSATTGGAPWQYIPPQLINRTEIVRGPRSHLYGADAVGGVVQGFTLAERDQDSRWVEAGGGSFAARTLGAGFSEQVGNTRFGFTGNYFETDGASLEEGGERKGYRNTSGVGSVRHDFENGGSTGVFLLRSEGRSEISSGDTDFMVQVLGAEVEVPITRRWDSGIVVSEARDESDTNGSVFDTRTRTARWTNTFALNRSELIAGAEYSVDEVDTTDNFTEDSRGNVAAFAQWITFVGDADFQLSGRWDDNEAFGEEVTGSVAAGYRLDPSHRVRTSYGTAFRAPTFNDLYFPFTDFGGGFVFEGNEDLSPETSETIELGIRGSYPTWFWDAALYQTDVDDLISNEFQNDGAMRPVNVEQARIQGLELSTGADIGRLELAANATFQDHRDRESLERLNRRTTRSGRIDADYTEGRVSFGASGVFEGSRRDGDDQLPGFATANLRVGVQLPDDFHLRFTMNNVFDRRYETAGGFQNAGRDVMLTLRYGAR